MTALLYELLGLELKMRQYEVGEAFVDGIEREAGPAGARPGVARAPRTSRRSTELERPTTGSHGSTAPEPRAGSVDGAGAALAPLRGEVVGLDDVTGRSSSACSGGPDSLALLAVACRARPRPRRGARRPRPAADERGRGEVVAAAAATLGVDVRSPAACDVDTGRNLEARARDARYEALDRRRAERSARPRCSSATPPTTRPRRCCSTCCAAAARRGSPGCRVRRGRIVRPLLGVRRAETRGVLRCARPRSGARSDERRPRATAASGSATRCSRCSSRRGARPRAGPRAPGRRAARRAELPRRAARAAWPPEPAACAECRAGAAAAGAGPPSGAAVARRATPVARRGRARARRRAR